jgi:Fe-S oxidoreductase
VRLFEEVKDAFDPAGIMNPAKIVRPPRMNDRRLFRYKPDYQVADFKPALEWPGYTGAGGGLQGAIEMCNNNGACRKFDAGVMCPSYRVTRDEKDVTRGRANTLRLALSGQIGAHGLASPEVTQALALCVGCKGCRRECPTGVDMARMKIEVASAVARTAGLPLHDNLIAYLPRYAPWAARASWAMNARDRLPGLPWLSGKLTGMTARRALPTWSARPYPGAGTTAGDEPAAAGRDVLLLAGLGYRVHHPQPADGRRPVCCGRTFLSVGLVDEARAEARRLIEAVMPHVRRGLPVIGIEPSCLLTLRDEMTVMGLGEDARILSESALLLEEFLVREIKAGRIEGPLGMLEETVHLHGHCHQKAFGALGAVEQALGLVEGLKVRMIESSCCGMAGAFGYGAATYEASMAMGELALLPAVRKAAPEAIIAADGFSCRHQIAHGAGRPARHVASILIEAHRAMMSAKPARKELQS